MFARKAVFSLAAACNRAPRKPDSATSTPMIMVVIARSIQRGNTKQGATRSLSLGFSWVEGKDGGKPATRALFQAANMGPRENAMKGRDQQQH